MVTTRTDSKIWMRTKESSIRRGLRYCVNIRHRQTRLVTEYKTRKTMEGVMSWETVGRPPAIELLLDEDIGLVELTRKGLGEA